LTIEAVKRSGRSSEGTAAKSKREKKQSLDLKSGGVEPADFYDGIFNMNFNVEHCIRIPFSATQFFLAIHATTSCATQNDHKASSIDATTERNNGGKQA
jgi:hypothetical protein